MYKYNLRVFILSGIVLGFIGVMGFWIFQELDFIDNIYWKSNLSIVYEKRENDIERD